MKKLSKLTETYWSGMNKRAQGTSVRKEDKKSFVTVDGVKYQIKFEKATFINEGQMIRMRG